MGFQDHSFSYIQVHQYSRCQFILFTEIVDGNLKMTLGMIWTIILRFAIQDISVEGIFINLFLPYQLLVTVFLATQRVSTGGHAVWPEKLSKKSIINHTKHGPES